MKQRKYLNTDLTRRNWIVLATSALSGCGGGDVSTAGAPGTGGTGNYALYSQGSISGFGSVIVNGVKYDDALALVQVNGVAAMSADLRLGMVAGVQGELSADVTLGTASHIEVWSIAQGLVTQLNGSVPGEFMLAGMTINADTSTVLDGFVNVGALTVGQRLAVWGLQARADGSHWTATRIEVVADTALVSTGLVQVVNLQKTLNGLLLTGSAVASLTAGQLVRVQGTLSITGSTLTVTSAKLLSPGAGTQLQGEAEIEGVVTSIASTSRFMLGSIDVDASSTSYLPVLGARVEVYGTWQNGVLKATKADIEDEETLHAVELEARIEQYTSQANFVVRGQRCDATQARISHGTAADLQVGVKVHIKGTKTGNVLMVTTLELDN
jgi:hypothetical protein